MNNREAITLLRNLEDSLDSYCELNEEGKTAFRMAIEALNCSEIPNNSDTISRRAAIEAIEKAKMAQTPDGEIYVAKYNAEMNIKLLPSVQPEPSEITDERAILHLQSTGWMQNHNREIYESGLKERLADDSESYDSLIPHEDDGDTISRQMAIGALARMMPRSYTPDGSHPADEEIFRAQEVFVDCIEALEILPSAQPEIIRCKDCKYMIDTGDDLMCDNAKGWVVATASDFGCVLAERRTDE